MLEFFQELGSKVLQFFSTKFGNDSTKRRHESLCDETSVISPAKRFRREMDPYDLKGAAGMTGQGFNFAPARRDLKDVTSFQFSTKANPEKVMFQGSPFPVGSSNVGRNHLNACAQPMGNGQTDYTRSNGFLEAKNRSLFCRILGENNMSRGIKSIDIRKRNKLAAKQCFRLEEKYKYQQLLNRHLSIHHGGNTPSLPAYSVDRHTRPDVRTQTNEDLRNVTETGDRRKIDESVSDDTGRHRDGVSSLLASVASLERGCLSAAHQTVARQQKIRDVLPDRALQRMRHLPVKALPMNDVRVASTDTGVVPVNKPFVPEETPRAPGHQTMPLHVRNHECRTRVLHDSDSHVVISDSPFPTSVSSQRSTAFKDRSLLTKKSATPEIFQRALKESHYANKEFLDKINSKSQTDLMKQSIVEKEMVVKHYRDEREKSEALLLSQMRNLLRTTVPLEEVSVPAAAEEEILEIPDDDEEEEEDDEVEEISNEFPELTDEQDSMVARALISSPPDQVLVEEFRLQLTRRDFATLAGLNWLNDEVINFYFNLIMKRCEARGYPKSYAFSTFFYPKVQKEGHKAVRRWTKAIDLFTYDYILIPVHLGNHWCLAVIDFRRKEIRYYDSMGMPNKGCLQTLRNYLSDEHKAKKESDFQWNGWQFISVKDVPQQMNGSDCGMFACKFAEYISRDAPITFSQRHMPYFRRRMVFEILTKKLM